MKDRSIWMLIQMAKEIAAKAHQGQCRKISNNPYYGHLENVAELLNKANFSDEVVAAGYLHDIIEDTNITANQLKDLFGEYIVKLVNAVSEDKSLSWEERKAETIAKLKRAEFEVKAIIAADKLDNTNDMLAFYKIHGENIWEFFNRGYEQQAWYYRNLIDSLYFGLYPSEIPYYFSSLRRNIDLLFPDL